MLYLILTVVFSTTFSLMMKHAHARRYGVLAVGCLNYVAAGVIGVLWAAASGTDAIPVGVVALGCLGGTMYVLCYLAIMAMLQRQGISVAAAMTRLAIAVPILAAVFLWRELPNLSQSAGLAVTFAAILAFDLRGRTPGTRTAVRSVWPLAGCFVTAGISRLAMKTFSQLYAVNLLPAYIGVWFGFAGLIAVLVLGVGRLRPRGGDWPFGIALGVVNVAAMFCSIHALRRVSAIVFFPVSAVGSLALVAVLAAVVWKERLDRRTQLGLVLASAALVLVNLR